MDGSFANDRVSAVEAVDQQALTPAEAELVAIKSVVMDLVRVVDTLAPGVLDRSLAVSRIRLQELERARQDESFDLEHLVLRFRVDLIERAQGRPPTQS